ncbi:GNAT family N-acetyltransferase [Streptomyces sp. NPDC029216]|uniref:GNAT family N-acetyltransferase n=1 Tax=Streptomyces sp. NPDC029216 TaxID=3154701 RepID=UPI00340FF0EE
MDWRAVSPADVDALTELLGRDEEATVGRRESGPAVVRSMLAAPGLDLATRTWAASAPDGSLLGFAALHPAPQPGELRAQLVIAPCPDAPAVTAALLDRLDAWAAHDLPTHDMSVTLYQLPGCQPHDQLLSRGWAIVHSSSRLTVALDSLGLPDHPASRAPTVRAARNETDLRTVHSVLNEAFTGDPEHPHPDFEDFHQAQRRREGYNPDLWLLAELDSVPAGALIARDPVDRAWIAWFGVHPAHRRHGLGAQLLTTAFSLLHARGHRTVGVDVDTHNTGAMQAYTSAGMTLLGAADQWRRTYV